MRPLLVLFLCGCPATEQTGFFRHGEEIEAVRIEVSAGDIRVGGRAGNEVEVSFLASGPAGAPRVTERVEAGVLILEGRCAVLSLCTVDVDVTIPPGIPVDLTTGAGNVVVDSLDGDVRVEIGDGNLTGLALRGDAFRARVGWGDVQVALARTPVDVTVDLARGDVRLIVPGGVYELDLAAFDGVSTVGVTDGTGPRLHVRTQSGLADVNGIEVPSAGG